jgi:putative flippase GtrA
VTRFTYLLKRTHPVGQLARYIAIGIASNLLGYTLYLLATYAGSPPKQTMTVLYVCGATVSFFCNKRLTFAHEGRLWNSALRYTIAHTMGYLLNLGLLVVFVDRLHYPHQLVQGLAIFVVAAFLFITFRLFVFAPPRREVAP